jgi:hypothetical protein
MKNMGNFSRKSSEGFAPPRAFTQLPYLCAADTIKAAAPRQPWCPFNVTRMRSRYAPGETNRRPYAELQLWVPHR